MRIFLKNIVKLLKRYFKRILAKNIKNQKKKFIISFVKKEMKIGL